MNIDFIGDKTDKIVINPSRRSLRTVYKVLNLQM